MTPPTPGVHNGGTIDAHDLGPQLEAVLVESCGGKLSAIRWFRSDWQIGGAATAYAWYESDAGRREVVVKFPVGPREYGVLTSLAGLDAPTPRLAVHGTELGGYDLAWVVMERLPGDPLAAHLHAGVFSLVIEAAARFHAACERVMEIAPAREHEWERLLDRARESIRANPSLPRASEWADAVKRARRALPSLLSLWNGRAMNACCHGDLHPGNCMVRPEGSPWGPPGPVLFDFAEVHRGHWVEDGVYLERQYWGRPGALDGVKPVPALAKARRDIGLDSGDNYQVIADVRRALMAATGPAFLGREGGPTYLNAALDHFTRAMDQLRL